MKKNDDILKKKILLFLEKLDKKKININNKKTTIFLLKKKADYEKEEKFIKELEEYQKTSNNEEKIIIEAEAEELFKKQEKIIKQIKNVFLDLDVDELSNKNKEETIIVEIRPGTGGTESCLFCRELYTMYAKLADKKNWKLELIETRTDKEGNFLLVSFFLKGIQTNLWMKNEAGVHRIQRVPKTESKGRIHTSTVTVAVLPEPTDVDLVLKPQEVKIESFAAGGPGGQHVNKTESAIRITHIPTGITAVSQESRDQKTNRERAYLVLQAKIAEKLRNEKKQKEKEMRISMIGSGERWEKIRTYNWMQNRITDHRIGTSWNNLEEIIKTGECQEIIEKLIEDEISKKIEAYLTKKL